MSCCWCYGATCTTATATTNITIITSTTKQELQQLLLLNLHLCERIHLPDATAIMYLRVRWHTAWSWIHSAITWVTSELWKNITCIPENKIVKKAINIYISIYLPICNHSSIKKWLLASNIQVFAYTGSFLICAQLILYFKQNIRHVITCSRSF